MKIAKSLTALVFFVTMFTTLNADEGMWIPSELQRIYPAMQKLGLKMSLDELYSVNTPSLKDAIVNIGGCTAEFISPEGLILTNHHCGYGNIQKLSTVENDYLTNGFWAKSKNEELPAAGKTASILIRIEKVTEKVLQSVTSDMSEDDRTKTVAAAIKSIRAEAEKEGKGYRSQVYSMFSDNEYYLYVYQIFRDVRLVGAPPSSIGKFGGDTDNWMWPRHTGDFTLFRIYCSSDGSPAEYSKDNVPYKPKSFLNISLKGYNENDFAMIWGYPGSTDRYLTSFGVQQKIDQLNPASVKLKYKKMQIMKEYMDTDDKVRIQYADKYAYLANFWKKSLEERKALIALKVADAKRSEEADFNRWANENADKKNKYGNVISDYERIYKERTDTYASLFNAYFNELTFSIGCQLLTAAYQSNDLADSLKKGKLSGEYTELLKQRAKSAYQYYLLAIDKKIFSALSEMFYKDLPKETHPGFFKDVESKFGGSFSKYADYMYDNSIFSSESNYLNFLSNPDLNKLLNDPAYITVSSLFEKNAEFRKNFTKNIQDFGKTKRNYLAGLMEMNPDKFYYPDANSSMRMTYGKVLSYNPRDAVHYNYYTTLKGVMEKEDPGNDEFIVPDKLKSIYDNKDYGRYSAGDEMPLAFLTDNDITGGNSGSPVMDAYGNLIGVAFDGNSEAMSSDIHFDKALQRTIICDIRYVLLIVEKYAGADNIINELVIK